MSVIASPSRKSRRWLHLWPLALFILLAIGGSLLPGEGPAPGGVEKNNLANRGGHTKKWVIQKGVGEPTKKGGGPPAVLIFFCGVQ